MARQFAGLLWPVLNAGRSAVLTSAPSVLAGQGAAMHARQIPAWYPQLLQQMSTSTPPGEPQHQHATRINI